MLSGSRTRAERLAKDLQEEGLNAFYGQDSDRILQPGEIMVAYGHARRGLNIRWLNLQSSQRQISLEKSRKSVKRKKNTMERESRTFRNFPLETM